MHVLPSLKLESSFSDLLALLCSSAKSHRNRKTSSTGYFVSSLVSDLVCVGGKVLTMETVKLSVGLLYQYPQHLAKFLPNHLVDV